MKNATLRGKPDAGNPHVRFDEGEVAPAKPRCGSLLYNMSSKPISVAMNTDSGEKTWLTPLSLIQSLGHFDLDPCVPDSMPWQTADRMVTKGEDGLKVEWHGRVWCNPPYGRESVPFLKKMAEHKSGITLIFTRTDTAAWHNWVFPYCDAVFFMKGRIRFCRENGEPAETASMPSVLVSYSSADTEAIRRSGIEGCLMKREVA